MKTPLGPVPFHLNWKQQILLSHAPLWSFLVICPAPVFRDLPSSRIIWIDKRVWQSLIWSHISCMGDLPNKFGWCYYQYQVPGESYRAQSQAPCCRIEAIGERGFPGPSKCFHGLLFLLQSICAPYPHSTCKAALSKARTSTQNRTQFGARGPKC